MTKWRLRERCNRPPVTCYNSPSSAAHSCSAVRSQQPKQGPWCPALIIFTPEQTPQSPKELQLELVRSGLLAGIFGHFKMQPPCGLCLCCVVSVILRFSKVDCCLFLHLSGICLHFVFRHLVYLPSE